MALYNDSDSDSDNEFFTNKSSARLTRNTNTLYRPGLYEDEVKITEFEVTTNLSKFKRGNIELDDDLSVGSDYEPVTVRNFLKATDMDSVDSDNDFEPYMRGRKLVLPTNDPIDDFLDGGGNLEQELPETGGEAFADTKEELALVGENVRKEETATPSLKLLKSKQASKKAIREALDAARASKSRGRAETKAQEPVSLADTAKVSKAVTALQRRFKDQLADQKALKAEEAKFTEPRTEQTLASLAQKYQYGKNKPVKGMRRKITGAKASVQQVAEEVKEAKEAKETKEAEEAEDAANEADAESEGEVLGGVTEILYENGPFKITKRGNKMKTVTFAGKPVQPSKTPLAVLVMIREEAGKLPKSKDKNATYIRSFVKRAIGNGEKREASLKAVTPPSAAPAAAAGGGGGSRRVYKLSKGGQ